jgi:hypothetical protein
MQEAILKMTYVVIAICDKFAEVWNSNLPFSNDVALIKAKLIQVQSFKDRQMTETKGATIEKKSARESLEEKALFVVNRLKSYANANDNEELAISVNIKKYDIAKLRDIELVSFSDSIYGKAQQYIGNLSEFGVTVELLSDLKATTESFNSLISKPRMIASESKNATANISTLLKEINATLKERMDLDIEVFRTTAPEFYTMYKSSRIVLGRKGSPLAVIANVTDKLTDLPLKDVKFTFTPANTTGVKPEIIEKESSELGHFNIKSMKEGMYMVFISKLGYAEQHLKVNMVNGETTLLDILMEKE